MLRAHLSLVCALPRLPVDASGKNVNRRMLADRLLDFELRTEVEALRTQMVEQVAPADEGPFVNPGCRRRGPARVRRRHRLTDHLNGADLEALRIDERGMRRRPSFFDCAALPSRFNGPG